jgi:hypothetical protein
MPASSHVWKFFRTGGLDQVALETGADLLALGQLDQKLWVALSCPVKGLELDEQTLALIDSDRDGRIRVPELLAAVGWAAARVRDAGILLTGADALPLAALNDATPEGKILLASAKQILANLGKKSADAISVADAADTAKIFAATPLNGDGVIPPEATDDPATQALIKDIIACHGGTADRTGSTGVTAAQIATFFADLAAYIAWVEKNSAPDIAILGDETAAAVNALQAVRAKAEDFFARCRLAAFDARALAALNRSETEYLAIAAKDLSISAAEVASFPLARIEAHKPLPLLADVNPAWAAALAALHARAVAPIFGPAKTTLTEAEWAALNAKFSAYETWLGGKAGGAVEKLGLARIREILAGPGRTALAELVAADAALAPEFQAVTDVARLTRYHRDLRALLHNFVNFADFYSPDRPAIFQAGTLYLDSRSTEFCVRVDAPAPLAAMSKAYIAYCDCRRPGSETMKVAACFTQGDSDYLFAGRNGIFYDRAGRDWDATITSVVDNPISIRQAFLSPYKKFVRLIEEQVAKRAAAADAAANAKLSDAATATANADNVAPTAAAPAKKIDIGTVAAMGVAVGAIGGALGAVATGLAKLSIFQLPLVPLGLIAVISGPSMIIAWIKLRQRNLGPLLEANGWAINGRVKINVPFGTKLTDLATLPANARRSLVDPYEDKTAARQRRLIVVLAALLLVAAGWIRWDAIQHRDSTGLPHYFWQSSSRAGSSPPN